MTYKQKLLDPRWQKKRLKVMERDNFKCTNCGNGKKTLHVHHLSYKGNPWDVAMSQLKTLCEPCHSKEHKPKVNKFRDMNKVLPRPDYPYAVFQEKKDYRIIPGGDLLFIWCDKVHGVVPKHLRDCYFKYVNARFYNNDGLLDLDQVIAELNEICFKERTVIKYKEIHFGLDLLLKRS